MAYKESDLVLQVSKNVNPQVWDEGFYQNFLDLLCSNRTYQKQATETALRYLNSGEYTSLESLAKENFDSNHIIQERFSSNFEAMKNELDLFEKLSGTIDLATGTGKSYIMIALALIMLASKKVNRVLVLVPSLTIESELTQKFKDILTNDQLIKSLGAGFVTPEILNGDSTLVENSIAIENRNAIYKAQARRNSIVDSLKDNGESTLVLNDETHHVYYSESNQWKEFISDGNNNGINFKYVIGLTGTPYKRRTKTGDPNEYFSDVIFRYSLREAIEQNFVKDIEYISKEDIPSDKEERWQVILNSHDGIAKQLEKNLGEKPITIIVTEKQTKADAQSKNFKNFLKKQRNLSDEEVDKIVLSVHSGTNAAADRLKLKNVDQPKNKVEFIFSVSMLTEGWDVKRVFQIVPDEERAFNSKLLIAQVLGRGLRRPNNWESSWGNPIVTVFNHEKWATNVKSIVDEILELRKVLTVMVNKGSDRNFVLKNIKYKSEANTTETLKMGSYNLWRNDGTEIVGIKLPTDSEYMTARVTMTGVRGGSNRNVDLSYSHRIFSVDEIALMLYSRFDDLDDKILREEYKNLWTIDKITEMINTSLNNSSNEVITKKIRDAFLSSMNIIFREGSKSVIYDVQPDVFFEVHTDRLPTETNDLNNFHKNRTLFYTDEFEGSLQDDNSKSSFQELKDTANGFKQVKITNKYAFKTPQFGITVSGIPETDFLKRLISDEVSKAIDSFIKSSDMNFYDFDYAWKKGTHHQTGKFNPDWFIKKGDTIIVVETKDDSQIINPDVENIGKNKAAIAHFDRLNKFFESENSKTRYKFTFLTPKNYDIFFDKLVNHDIQNFNSDLDVALSNQKYS